MSSTEWDMPRCEMRPNVWSLFEHNYTSMDVARRKPSLSFRVKNIVSSASSGTSAFSFTTVEEFFHRPDQ
ncbi:hypothetical protein BD310DRAFT_937227 [Dichomitus squalens]|uniref:Uncharacterized protein n=1 Tax=Dichomitus squalens TaxID=114155 RepID=A0A4Q9PFV7_9APHY|nr:hypothetical protein BD310DRAFT_937227 [Dichomitus squalens]